MSKPNQVMERTGIGRALALHVATVPWPRIGTRSAAIAHLAPVRPQSHACTMGSNFTSHLTAAIWCHVPQNTL